MSTTVTPPTRPAPSAGAVLLPLYRVSVAQYLAMVEHGIFTPEDHLELLDGYLVAKMTPRPAHAVCVDLVRDALARILPAGWHVRAQAPLVLSSSVPEPDDGVAKGERRDYRSRHPGASEMALVVEVSDTTLSEDRTTKKAIYAEAKIPTYWIVNLVDSTLEAYSDPVGTDYTTARLCKATDEVSVCLDGQEVGRLAVRDLLP